MPTFRQDNKLGDSVPLIKTPDIGDKQVTERKLADGSVTSSKLSTEIANMLSLLTTRISAFKVADSLSSLPAEENTIGWLVDNHLYVYVGNGSTPESGMYQDCGELRGPQGIQGEQGLPGLNGKSAYDIWTEQPGNEDKSEIDFLEFTRGSKGDKGDQGERGYDISNIEQLVKSTEDGGKNIIRVTRSDGWSKVFEILNGSKGSKGDKGTSIVKLEQTRKTTESSGLNTIEATLDDGTKESFEIYNGAKGEQGDKGEKGDKGDQGEIGPQGNSGITDASSKTLVNDAITGGETDFLSAEVGKLGILTYDCSKGGSVTHATLQDAINSVPTTFQKVGLSITYKSGNTIYRYTLKANAWSADPANWFSVEHKLSDLSSKTIDVFNFTPDCAVNQKGELIANNKYCITRKIDASNLVGKSIIWACGSDKQDLVVASLAFYDSSDAFLGYYSMHSTRTITVDENTSYIIATMDKENIDKSYIADVYGNILWSPFGNKVSDNGALPSYYNTYIANKLEKINQLPLTSSRKCDDFIFITDMHIEVNYMQSPKLIKHIVSRTNLKKLFNGGDVMNGQATREEGRIQLRRWMDLMSFIDQYITLGNHDTNSSWAQTKDGWFSYDEVYNMLYKPLEEKINTNGQLYYCLDNESQKIRYFFLNAQWPEEQTNHEAQLKYNDQLSWLETKCREIGKDWSIVVVQHIFFTNYTQIKNDDGSYITIKAERATIAGYLVSKLKEISSNELMPNVLFVMVGHTHWDWVEFFDGGFPVIATSSDSSYNWEGPGNIAWTKKKGTVEEQCFDVVHADIGKELITSIRIGQGNDRKIHLDIKNLSVGESLTLLTSLEGNVKWRSVYEDIATVDNGVINAKKAGMTTIIADNKNGEQEFWGINVS